VRYARRDIEHDRDVGDGCPPGEPESVAEEDLVGTNLDEERRQSPEIAEDRADVGVSGVGPSYVVRNPSLEPIGCEDWVDLPLLGEGLSGQGQIHVGREQVCRRRQGQAGFP